MSQTIIAEAQTAPAEAGQGETGHTEGTDAGHTETTGAEGGHGGGVFPPLDTKTFPSQIFWLVIFFALLYLLMSKVALPRIAAILKNRMSTINGDLARAQALKEETEAAIASYEKALADARAKAQSIAAENKARMEAEMDAERAAVEKTLAARIGEAEASIAAARDKAMAQVNEVASDTAAEIVSQLTGASASADEVAKAIAGAKG